MVLSAYCYNMRISQATSCKPWHVYYSFKAMALSLSRVIAIILKLPAAGSFTSVFDPFNAQYIRIEVFVVGTIQSIVHYMNTITHNQHL